MFFFEYVSLVLFVMHLNLKYQKKTVCMVVSKYQNVINSGITLKGNPIKQVKTLSTWITNDGKCDKEINTRIAMAKETFINSTTSFTITIYD